MKDGHKEVLFGAVAAAFIAATIVFSVLNTPSVQPVGPVYPLQTAGASGTTAVPPPLTVSGQETSGSERVNINTADQDALMQLDGIGETLAARIIAYREAHGAFLTVEELLQVEGIGEKRLAAIRERIAVE